MADNKKSFLLYCDLIHTVKKMPDDKAGQLFKHILSYVNDEHPNTDDLIIQLVFEPIKQQLKRDLIKFNEICKSRSEVGRLGGIKSGKARRSKSNENEANEAIASKSKQNEHDIDNDSDIDIDKDIKKKISKFIVPSLDEVKKYCIERKNTISPSYFINHYEANGWLVGKNKMKDWKAAIRTWESRQNNNTNSVNKPEPELNTDHYLIPNADKFGWSQGQLIELCKQGKYPKK